jgi:hypothetical protein
MLIPGHTYKIIYNSHVLIVKYIKYDWIYNFKSNKTLKSDFIFYINQYLDHLKNRKHDPSVTDPVISIKDISELVESTFKHHFE